MANRRKISRIAGFLYLIVVITGMFSLAYIPKQLYDWENPSTTFNNLVAHETLFRFGIASSVVCYIAFVGLALFLYILLETVHQLYAKIMLISVLISVPISISNLQNKYAILDLISNRTTPNSVTLHELHKQTMFFLNQYDYGIFVTTLFWGLWLLPLGYLVYRSTFLPKFLGILLMLGCLGYLVNYFGTTLYRGYIAIGIAKYFKLLPAIAEIGTCFWLLLVGAKEKNNN